MENQSTMLHSMLAMLLDNLGYTGPRKNPDEMLPQLHIQCQRRLESSETKMNQLSAHLDALNSRTVEVSDEVANIQDVISAKFREMHALLEDKEVAFKQQIATLAAEMQQSIATREAECQDVIQTIQTQTDQLRAAMAQKDELSFVSTVAHVPLAETKASPQLLQIPTANFQARATLKSEPIVQMIQNLTFDLQPADTMRARPTLSASTIDPPAGSIAGSPLALRSSSMYSPSRQATPRDTPPSKDLFIGGLPFDADESSVLAIFEKYGAIAALDMSNVSKGFAFMSFDSIESAKQAVADSPPVLNKRTLNVRFKLYAIYLSSTLCASFEAPMPDDASTALSYKHGAVFDEDHVVLLVRERGK